MKDLLVSKHELGGIEDMADAEYAPPALSNLPDEVFIHILSYLPTVDLGSCSLVSRMFYFTITNSILLQYRIALHKAGYEDNFNCPLSYAEKLELVKRREKAWLTCTPDFQEVAPLPFDPGSVYDLSGDLYFLGDSSRKRLKYLPLPNSPDDKPAWKTFDSGDNRFMVDFALNVYEHDLIALITAHHIRISPNSISYLEIELTIHKLSTGAPHPQAKQPSIPVVTSELRWGSPSVNMEIVGDYLALVTTFWRNPLARCTVSVYEWKTGKLVMQIDGNPDTYSGIVFLAEDILLLPNTLDRVLEIWRIPGPFEDPPTSPLRRLGLPRLSARNALRYISCRGEPNPISKNSSLSYSSRPFHCNPLESVVLLHLRIHSINALSLFTIFVHRKSLLSLLDTPSESVHDEKEILWSDWAPARTFCVDIRGDIPSRWITTTCGQRFVIILNDDDDTDDEEDERRRPCSMMVFDFNPHNVKRVKRELMESPDENTKVFTDERAMVDSDMFMEEIVSCLPYVASTTKETFKFDGVLMDESRLLGLQTNNAGQIQSVEILHFG